MRRCACKNVRGFINLAAPSFEKMSKFNLHGVVVCQREQGKLKTQLCARIYVSYNLKNGTLFFEITWFAEALRSPLLITAASAL